MSSRTDHRMAASAAPSAATIDSSSRRTSALDSSAMKRRSKTATQRSGTIGVCSTPIGWPACSAFRLMEAWRALAGSTGSAVVRAASFGFRSRSILASSLAIASAALWPSSGMLPCAVTPRAVTSAQYTPR